MVRRLKSALRCLCVVLLHSIGLFVSASCITDVNECDVVNGFCSHICKNTEGSFQCVCPPPLFLDPTDQRSCRGELYQGLITPARVFDLSELLGLNTNANYSQTFCGGIAAVLWPSFCNTAIVAKLPQASFEAWPLNLAVSCYNKLQ